MMDARAHNPQYIVDDAGLPQRQAPHNIQAEQELLGALLVHNESFDKIEDLLPEHFFDPLHGRIYQAIKFQIEGGKRATPVTLKTFFEDEEPLESLTIPQYLARLAANATSVINIKDYAETIYKLGVRRHLILIGAELVDSSQELHMESDPANLIEETEQRLYEIANDGTTQAAQVLFSDALTKAYELAKAAKEKNGLVGLKTGFIDFDQKVGGLHASDLYILAGRPSMGKTALATNIAYNVAKDLKDGFVVFYSLEMSDDQLALRIISSETGVSSQLIRTGKVDNVDYELIQVAQKRLSQIPMIIDVTGGISIGRLAVRARKLKRQKNIKLIIVDYLQLMTSKNKRNQNRVQEITDITMGLKALAKELDVPIIALSQLSRQVENRENKRPQLSDLRESGSIEQDADAVMFVYREEYYLARQEPDAGTDDHQQWQIKKNMAAGKAELIIGKQRHGPIGTIPLIFNPDLTKFSNFSSREVSHV